MSEYQTSGTPSAGRTLASGPQNGTRSARRLIALLLAAIPLTLLGVAARLQPDAAGLGTHQQLGLPPCSMRVLFGTRCPSCGMTTSWAHFMNGAWLQSAEVNAGGFLAALVSLGFAALALRTACSGEYPSRLSQQILLASLLAVAAVTLADWTLRLATN